MPTRRITLCTLVVAALAAAVLTGCAEDYQLSGGGAASPNAVEETRPDDVAEMPAAPGLEQASADGMPGLPITECPQLDLYEYDSTGSRSVWHLAYTCVDRSAFDATAASFVADGYESSPTIISEGDYVSERIHLLADANGGSTEVQLNLVGWGDELEYEAYVTIELP